MTHLPWESSDQSVVSSISKYDFHFSSYRLFLYSSNMSRLYGPQVIKDKILTNISAAIREVCLFYFIYLANNNN